VTAWAVNQVWWTDRRTFEQMLDAGERLRDRQRASLKGKVVNLREAIEARQDRIAAVLELAVRALGGADRVSASIYQRIAVTCDVLATGDVPAGTVLGRCTEDLSPGGFGVLAGLVNSPSTATTLSRDNRGVRKPAEVTPFVAPEPGQRARTYAKAPRVVDVESARQKEQAAARARAAALAEARNIVGAAESEWRAAERELKERRALQDDAGRAYESAQARTSDLERQLADARRNEAATKAALSEAKRQLSAALTVRDRAAQSTEKAREQLEKLEGKG
jgi:hypothetical protein